MILYRYAIIFLTLTITGSVVAGEMIDQTLKVPDTGILLIDNSRGMVKITGWDKKEVSIQGAVDDSAHKLIFKNKGHKTLIKVVMEGVEHQGNTSDLKVFMPKNHKLRFKGVGSSFVVVNLTNGVEGKTINGDLTIQNVHNSLKISSVSGKITVSDSSGKAKIQSVTGTVDFSGKFDKAKIKSTSGDIIADIGKTHNLRIKNFSGDTTISGNLLDEAHVKLTSVSGNIHYTAKDTFSGDCSIASQFGGKILNLLTSHDAWSEDMDERKLSFVSGDGSGKLVMNTVSGSVTLDK
ncbi:MAG: hypothetical protein ACI8WB_005630 [Phenylobacterium sp.]